MLVALTRSRCLYLENLLVPVFCVLFGAYVQEGGGDSIVFQLRFLIHSTCQCEVTM